MDGNASGENSVNVDWTTDDELEINAESVTSSHPTLTTDVSEVTAVNGKASSSTGSLQYSKLVKHFVAMGFPEKLVLKAIEEKGGNTELILNTLLTYLNLQDSPQRQLSFGSAPSSSDYSDTILADVSDMDS